MTTDVTKPTEVVEDGAKIEISQDKYDEMQQEIAKSKQNVDGLVEEIKDVRAKKQLAEDELAKQKETTPPTTPPADAGTITEDQVNVIVANRLAEERKIDTETLKATKIVEFKAKNQEFSEDNDPGGIKFAAFERKLKTFNLDGVTTGSQMDTILNDTRKLLGGETTTVDEETYSPISTTTPSTSSPDSEGSDKKLSKLEKDMVNESFGGDAEKYLQQKAKHPEAIEQLLRIKQNGLVVD